jgi:hypothetical protein
MKHHDGHDKEPKTMNGPKAGGKHPDFHSHSARRKRHVRVHGKKQTKY